MVTAVVLSGCLCVPPRGSGIGDSGTSVTIRNGTGADISVIEVRQGAGNKDLVSPLAAGAVRQSLWHFTTGSLITVRALDEAGRETFCHRFSYQEVRAADGVVVITDSHDCN